MSGTAYTEHALVFACQQDSLVGVLAQPAATAQPLAVLIVVGGPQYRGGSHRHFVQLSRELAAAGFPTLRFDVRGMGDSEGEARSFEQLDDDIGAALAALQSRAAPGTRIVLWGLCDGASAALLYLQRRPDPRVAGVCLLNPWVRSTTTQARTHVKHYYLQRLLQPSFWRKLLRGAVGVGALRELGQNVKLASAGTPAEATSFQQRMAHGLAGCGGPALLVLSGSDYTAKEFLEYVQASKPWQALLAAPRVRRCDVAGADHTFSEPPHKAQLNALTLDWLRTAF